VTGSMLFAAEASHLVVNPMLQLKAVLLVAGLVNIAMFELWGKQAVVGLAPAVPMPGRAKVAGGLSLAMWLAVAACGRSIAYF